MNVLACLAAFIAMALTYLCSRNQRLLGAPLGGAGRLAAWAFGVGAVVAWMASETSLPGIVAAITALMTGAVALPYLTWLLRPAAGGSR